MAQPREYRQARFSRPSGATEILLVRHGESAPAREGEMFPLVDGHGDPPLDPVGEDQAQRVADRLAGQDIAALYVTTLRRTVETAAPLAARLGLTPVVAPDLREVFLGEWEGGPFRKHTAEGHPIALRMLAEERWDVIPGAEPADAFATRVREAIGAIAGRHPDELVVAVTHGGVIGHILAAATGARPFSFVSSANCSISHLVVVDDRWIVRRYNDTSHLDPGFTTPAQPLT